MHRRRGRAAGVRGPPCNRANPVGLVPAIGALRDDALASAIITAAASVPEASHTVICLKYSMVHLRRAIFQGSAYGNQIPREEGILTPTRATLWSRANPAFWPFRPIRERPIYEFSKRRLTWPSGAVATTYSADEPDACAVRSTMRHRATELGAWRDPEAWDMLMFGMRLGADPRTVVTTTPRPAKLIRDLVRDPTCVVTRPLLEELSQHSTGR